MRTHVIVRALLAATSVLLASASQLGVAEARSSSKPSAETPYCVLHLSEGKTVDCYRTFTEAIADGTNGRVSDAPATVDAGAGIDAVLRDKLNSVAVKSGTPQAKAATGGTTIGVEYINADFQSSSYVVEVGWGCDGNTDTADWLWEDLGGSWLNDGISSFQTFADCNFAAHFEHHYFKGAQNMYFPHRHEVRNMDHVAAARADGSHACYCLNDKTSSVIWH